jgi:hypothetical protein
MLYQSPYVVRCLRLIRYLVALVTLVFFFTLTGCTNALSTTPTPLPIELSTLLVDAPSFPDGWQRETVTPYDAYTGGWSEAFEAGLRYRSALHIVAMHTLTRYPSEQAASLDFHTIVERQLADSSNEQTHAELRYPQHMADEVRVWCSTSMSKDTLCFAVMRYGRIVSSLSCNVQVDHMTYAEFYAVLVAIEQKMTTAFVSAAPLHSSARPRPSMQ